jgi:hypothetical protein
MDKSWNLMSLSLQEKEWKVQFLGNLKQQKEDRKGKFAVFSFSNKTAAIVSVNSDPLRVDVSNLDGSNQMFSINFKSSALFTMSSGASKVNIFWFEQEPVFLLRLFQLSFYEDQFGNTQMA